MSDRVVVVGGGVSGLAAAHRILELDPAREVVVLDAAGEPGGALRTERTEDGYVIELGPDSIITDKPWALALAKRLGLEGEIVKTRPESRGAYVVAHGRLERVPEGFSLMAPVNPAAFLASPILSWRGKARAALDLVLPRSSGEDDESLASFVRRRFGEELLERLAQPLVGGIYGADPELLSLRATMPRFVEVEQSSRSVAYGLWLEQRRGAAGGEAASGARYGLFISFRDGCQRLVDALVERLGDRVRTGITAERIERGSGETAYWVHTQQGELFDAEHVVLAVPAHRAASMLASIDDGIAALLASIPYGSAVTATFAWRREEIPHPLDAYGFVVPTVERRDILAATWSSRKWPGRVPAGMELVRVFLGTARDGSLLERDDDAIAGASRRELRDLMGIRAEPQLTRITRFPRAMPHYHLGHLALVDRIEARVADHPGLALAGNAYRGVGIPDAIHRGEQAAESIVDAGA